MINNTGQVGVFVLPSHVPAPPGGKPGATDPLDDYTKGVSLARAEFATNSANIEGWALYSEAILKPYMPLDGQLISLQQRLTRAARAFLDPELQASKIAPEQAKRLLVEDVLRNAAYFGRPSPRSVF